ncbi:MAG: hypothetical protein ACYCQI_04735 [Gammaproteobacteria bacterium]
MLRKEDLAHDSVFVSTEEKSPSSPIADQKPEFPDGRKSKSKVAERKFLAINHNELQLGDIPLFLPSAKGMNCSQKMICCMQALTKRHRGHYEITHASIFVGYKEKEGKKLPQIADVTAKGFRIGTLKEDQPILIFRPLNPEVGRLIAEEAKRIAQNPRKPYWDCCTAVGMVFKRKQLDPERKITEGDKEISQATVCSKLNIQVIKRALRQYANEEERKQYYLHIESDSTVKDLEAELFRNPNYEMRISFGKNNLKGSPYEIIQNEIRTQLQRLETNAARTKKPAILKKYAEAKVAFENAIETLDKSPQFDEIEKAIYLAEHMEVPFAVNTGCGARNTSAAALKASMRSLNLFQSVVDKYKDMHARGFARSISDKFEISPEDAGFEYIRMEEMKRGV